MTDQQPANQETQGNTCDASSCGALMEKMMGENGCDCSEMMSGMLSHTGEGGCAGMMSQMMATCCGARDDTKETPAPESNREA